MARKKMTDDEYARRIMGFMELFKEMTHVVLADR